MVSRKALILCYATLCSAACSGQSAQPVSLSKCNACAGIRGLSSFHIAVSGTSILIFPMLFIQSFKRLSWLNMIGFISTMVVTATMIVLVALDPFRKHMPTQVGWCTVLTPDYNGQPALQRHILPFLMPSWVSGPLCPLSHALIKQSGHAHPHTDIS